MKGVYETPEIELVEFETEDVITSSSGIGGASGNDLPVMPISLSVR